jgi:AraC-like DNA-binding protein
MSGSPSAPSAPSAPAPPTDVRGILDPALMQRHVALHRYPAGPLLDGIVDWFWAVSWSLPDGVEHVQPVLSHPAANVSIGTVDDAGAGLDHPAGRLYGLVRGISRRRLSGMGWTVAAKTTVGGLGALVTVPAQSLTDRRVSLDDALGLDGDALGAQVTARSCERERVDLLRAALEGVVRHRDPQRVAAARRIARAARPAERNPAVTRPEQLAAATGVGLRSLQRLFAEHVGAGPAWVIRRWRVIEAADAAVSGDSPSSWAEVAAQLGYADQAHLVREFRASLGTTPAAYAARQRA